MTDPMKPERAQRTMPPATASAPENQSDERGPGRAPRVPLGAHQLKLAHAAKPGFVIRWFNDQGSRIEDAKRAWWAHVLDETTKQPIKRTVGVAKEGGGLTAYLMEIPRELFREDQDAKDARLREFDEFIHQGAVGDQDGRYQVKDASGRPKIKIGEVDVRMPR